MSSPATTNCNSFYRRLRGGSQNFCFCARLFPTLVRNSHIRRSILSTLSQMGTHLSRFSIIIVVHNKNTASSLSNFSACLLTTTYTRFPLPVVANVNRRQSSAILSSITRAHMGAPATTTRFLVRSVSDTTSRLRVLTSHLRRNIEGLLRRRRHELSNCGGQVPSTTCRHVSSTGVTLLAIQGSIIRTIASSLFHRHRHLRLLRRQLTSTSPRGLLTHNCDVALGSKGMIGGTSRLRRGSVVAAHLRGNRIISVMRVWLSFVRYFTGLYVL